MRKILGYLLVVVFVFVISGCYGTRDDGHGHEHLNGSGSHSH